MTNFAGKVAVVTGGSNGIGRGIAEHCADMRMKVVVVGMTQSALDDTRRAIEKKGAAVLAVRADVSKYEEVEDVARRTLEAFGSVDLLFNNAGAGNVANSWEASLKDWKWLIDVNLWGVIHGIKVFVPIMLAQKSECHVVNTSSLVGLTLGGGSAVYRTTKHAVVALSETLYCDLAGINSLIGVSVLCPGWVKTNIMLGERNRPDELKDPIEGYRRTAAFESAVNETGKGVESGMAPTELASKVFEAIRNKSFYIFPPEAAQYIHARGEDIVAGRNPRLS